jgi:hypothetical protein
VEDLTPPIGIRGGDPSTATKVLACQDVALHWVRRQAVHQLWPRPTTLRPPPASTLAARHSAANQFCFQRPPPPHQHTTRGRAPPSHAHHYLDTCCLNCHLLTLTHWHGYLATKQSIYEYIFVPSIFFNPIIFSQSCKKFISLDIFPSFICLVYHGNMNLQAIDFAYTDQMKILMIHLVYS